MDENRRLPTRPGEAAPARLPGPTSYLVRGGPAPKTVLDTNKLRAFLRRQRWVMLGGFFAVISSVLLVTLLLPEKYESTASFLIEQQGQAPVVPVLEVLDRLGRTATLQTEVELIQSRRVLEPAVQALGLHALVREGRRWVPAASVLDDFTVVAAARPGEYELRADEDGVWGLVEGETGTIVARGLPGGNLEYAGVRVALPAASDSPAGPYEIRIAEFDRTVAATQGRAAVRMATREAELLRLTCEAATAIEARDLCEAISNSYMELRADLQRAEATAAAEFLNVQTEIVKTRLSAAEDSLGFYAQTRQAVALDTRASEEVRQSAALWAQREELVTERAGIASLLERIQAGGGSHQFRDLVSFPRFLAEDNRIVPSLLADIVELETRRNDLSVRRSDADVEMRSINSRIAELENQLLSIAVGYERALEVQIASLDRAINSSRASLASIPRRQIEVARLERQVTLLEELYASMLLRLREAEIAQAVELPSVRVVDSASLPFRASWPKKGLNMAVGFFAAAGFGLLLGLWRDLTDTRVREREGLEEETGVPVLGVIPGTKDTAPVLPVGLVPVDGEKLPPSPYSIVPGGGLPVSHSAFEDRGVTLEAFRSLGTDLGFVGRRAVRGGFRRIAVTSATRGEGKTFTASNLAVTRASHGVKTLLIDADLRARGVSRFLSMPHELPGLSDVILRKRGLRDTVREVEVGPNKRLSVLPAGSMAPDPAPLLGSDEFWDLLHEQCSYYDLVIVDTPPLSMLADATPVASWVDGVIVVVRSGMTDRSALDLTLDRLERTGARIAGIVLNDADMPTPYTRYGYGTKPE